MAKGHRRFATAPALCAGRRSLAVETPAPCAGRRSRPDARACRGTFGPPRGWSSCASLRQRFARDVRGTAPALCAGRRSLAVETPAPSFSGLNAQNVSTKTRRIDTRRICAPTYRPTSQHCHKDQKCHSPHSDRSCWLTTRTTRSISSASRPSSDGVSARKIRVYKKSC